MSIFQEKTWTGKAYSILGFFIFLGDVVDFVLFCSNLKNIQSRESKNSYISDTRNAPSLVTAVNLESFLGVQKNL